mmetsp:Transcript_33103/g.82451  ORF Transcript_33103/g.82451 Transcript_33103/m.82451 type:complete len:217 (+) Transcript_33103:666-1316(+)
MAAARWRMISASTASPRKAAHSCRKGFTSTLMKPIWQLATTEGRFGFRRSMKGEMGRSFSISMSPWWKNSSMERKHHSRAIGRGLAGLHMSAACRAMVSSSRESFFSNSLANTSPATLDLNLLRRSKWLRMSVPSTMAITVSLKSLYCSLLSALVQSQSSASRREKARARWWFSRIETSLYVIASASREASRKELFTPVWPRSWMMAAIKHDSISR